jgi:hypothetical protein
MLVEPDPVIAQAIELLPGFEMLGIGPCRDLRSEIFLLQRIGQLAPDLQMLKLFTISQEIEYEDFHICLSPPDNVRGKLSAGPSLSA